jgi:hypothetical protein
MSNRPMSEHEGALFDAVLVIAAMVLEMGADKDVFRAKLEKARAATDALGNKHGAATLDFMMSSLFGPFDPAAGPATDPAPKPSFRIV